MPDPVVRKAEWDVGEDGVVSRIHLHGYVIHYDGDIEDKIKVSEDVVVSDLPVGPQAEIQTIIDRLVAYAIAQRAARRNPL